MTETPVTGVRAPEPHSDPEFDTVWDQAWAAVTAAGNPEGLDPDAARQTLAEVMAQHAGRSFAPSPAVVAAIPPDLGPRTLVIPRPSGDPLWWDDPDQAEFTDHFILTRRALGAAMPGGLLITGPSGCVAGDTIVHVNRGGKGTKYRIDQLVARETHTFHGRGERLWNYNIPTRIARADGGVIKLGYLASAWCSGDKETFTLRTRGGRYIRATAQHPFLTPDGWTTLGDLRPGMTVMVNAGRGRSTHKPKPTYRLRTTLYHPNQAHASGRPNDEFRVPEHRLVLEAEMNDLGLDTYLSMLRTDPIRSRRLRFLSHANQVHHVDGNPRNNDIENLVEMSEVEHHRLHAREGHGNHVLWQVGADVVESVERFGVEPTYDLQTEDDPHNFIANGFVVHNSGKTEGVVHAVERVNKAHGLSLRLFRMDCATVTDPQKWFGRREVDKDGTRYEKSDFILAVERGDVVLLDELTRLHPSIHNGVMSLLDGSNSVHLSDLNVTVARHPETVFIATANIGVQYGGTHRLDAAMRERFPYSIERPFPPADVEPAILASRSGCDMDGASRLVKVAVESRRLHASGDLRTPVSTRTLVYAALLVAAGMTEKEALEFTAVPIYDSDANGIAGAESERAKFRVAIKGKLG